MRRLLIPLLALIGYQCMAQSPCDTLAARNASFHQELIRQRLELDGLIKRIDAGTYDLAKAQKEAEVLRSIMKAYITTIDSLSKSNIDLTRQIDELRRGSK